MTPGRNRIQGVGAGVRGCHNVMKHSCYDVIYSVFQYAVAQLDMQLQAFSLSGYAVAYGDQLI